MKGLKNLIINLIMFTGIVLIGISALQFYNIRQQRIKALEAYEQISEQGSEIDENPVIIWDAKEYPILKGSDRVETDLEGKKLFKREDYKNGMMIISIPKIKVKAPVIKGTTVTELKLGPGLYEISSLPDVEGANICIAAHRVTYGAWFKNVDLLVEGDDIELYFNNKTYEYKVEKVFIVEKDDWSVIKNVGYSALTLTSCHPRGSFKQRIVVRAKLQTSRQ
jgi:LPXTG-site transpeptidase (sortase) family protein